MRNLSTQRIARAFESMTGGRAGDDLEIASKEATTWLRYEAAWAVFGRWCEEASVSPMPASTETLRRYFRSIVEAGGTSATVHVHRAAIGGAHRLAGHAVDWAPLRELLQGIRRRHGQPRHQARPLLATELQGILGGLDATKSRDARDGALLALGWGAALRQSELVTLTWERRGTDSWGFVRVVTQGISVTLAKSKTSQERPATVIVPVADMPAATEWLEVWARVAGRTPCAPVFVTIGRDGALGMKPLAPDRVAAIVKVRVLAHLIATGMDEIAAVASAGEYSGHSLRAGYATQAALGGLHEWRIRQHCRHASLATTARYIRAALDWTSSGLGGVGF